MTVKQERESQSQKEDQSRKTAQTTQRIQEDMRTERCNDIVEIGGSITWRSTPANRTKKRAVRLGKEKKILTIHSEVTPRKGETYKTMLNE